MEFQTREIKAIYRRRKQCKVFFDYLTGKWGMRRVGGGREAESIRQSEARVKSLSVTNYMHANGVLCKFYMADFPLIRFIIIITRRRVC